MRQQIFTKNAPNATHVYSQAIKTNGLIFLAGQIHNTADGVLVDGTLEEKLAQIFRNITAVLKAADSTLDDIVKLSLFVTDIADMPVINEHYPRYFNKPLPAREAVCVKALPFGATVEISVIATAK